MLSRIINPLSNSPIIYSNRLTPNDHSGGGGASDPVNTGVARDHAVTLAELHSLISMFDVVMSTPKSSTYSSALAHALMNDIRLDLLREDDLLALFNKVIRLDNNTYMNYLAANPSLNKIEPRTLNALAENYLLNEPHFILSNELLKNLDLRKVETNTRREIFQKAEKHEGIKSSLEINEKRMSYILKDSGSLTPAS